ncbi:MAG TPA: transglycosylase SLT domain-containing protein [Caulobacterales bacterium]|nr:transglycosylase SLT domain-containing protein [Caulobacterales bacterium]
MRVDSALQQAAIQAVERASQSTGVDFGALLETAKRESGLDRNAQAKTSSAAGLFQFIESTWLDLVDKYGAKYGLAPAADAAGRKKLLDLRYDPELAAQMAGELTRENGATLEAKLGRAAQPGELYAAHVLGVEGAAKLIQAPPEAHAADLFPKAAAANRGLFYSKDGVPVSAAALLARLNLTPNPAREYTSMAPAASASLSAPPAASLLTALGETLGLDLWAVALRAYRRDNER